MAAHAAVPTGRRFSTHGWGFQVTIGVLYGLWASTIVRDGGPTTLGQLWLALISAIVLAVAMHMLHRFGRALPRELHATSWGVLSGTAVGFLYSLSDASILSSSGLGLAVGAVTALGAYYTYYTHEDAAGRPAPY